MLFSAVVFDFDGTLVRSHLQVYGVIAEMSAEYGFPLPSAERLREMSTQEAMKAMGLRAWQLPYFTVVARKKLKSRAQTVEMEPGIHDLLRELSHDAKIKCAVMTSNSRENVEAILHRHSARPFFSAIFTSSSLLGKHRGLGKMPSRLAVPRHEILYVGDETRDIEAARRSDTPCAAVSWGFHSSRKLGECQPNFLVHSVSELRALILNEVR